MGCCNNGTRNGEKQSFEICLNDEQREMFRLEALKWINKFGLKFYEVFFTTSGDEYEDALSVCFADTESGNAILATTTQALSDIDLTDNMVRKAAFHEVCELMLWPIRQVLRETRSDLWVNTEIHKIIRMWENVVFSK